MKITITFKITAGITVGGLGLIAFLNFLSLGPRLVIRDWDSRHITENSFSGSLEIQNEGGRDQVNTEVLIFAITEDKISCYKKGILINTLIRNGKSMIAEMPEFFWENNSRPKWIAVIIRYQDSGLRPKLLRKLLQDDDDFYPYIFNSLKAGKDEIEADPQAIEKIKSAIKTSAECSASQN